MKKLSEYFKPTSFTWWTAIASIGYGIFTQNIEAISIGLVGIGLRTAVAKGQDK